MSDANLRQIRVLHIVSAGALASSLQQSLFMPLLTRLPRARVKSLVACLSPGAVPSAVLRQSGVPTYDLAISRKGFSPRALQELQQATHNFRPDVIQAWGHTAQVISALLRPRCDWKPRLVWSIADTAPLAKNAGLIDRQKLKYAAKFAARADRIVYSSDAAAAGHRRVGFPEGEHETIAPGVDATRFKPDFAARRKLREQLNLPGEAFVIGMYAPFQPEYDFSTLIKAVGELIKINPNVAVVLAGHGVQKGNAPLMALVGGGALATRVHLLGEWSDISALYNACDIVCSSALNDQARMNLVMAMLCGVPCVATGMGAQGEVIAQHGVAIEPGNPGAFVKGITRLMQMAPEKRTFMAQGARKHALANYVYVRSLQKYLQLYYDLIGRQSLVTQDLPTPEVDPTLTVPPALPSESELNAAKRKPPTVADWNDPDSLESKVSERQPEELPKWRLEQEQERTRREAELAAQVAATKSNGDVLQVFETQNSSAPMASPMAERARGVAEDVEELLSPDLLAAEAPSGPRASNAPSGSRKNTSASQPASAAAQPDAAKQAALKAARMASLQPIAPPVKRTAAVKPSAADKAVSAAPVAQSSDLTIDFNSTQPVDLLSQAELLHTAPAPAKSDKVDGAATTSSLAEKIGNGAPRPSSPAPKDLRRPAAAKSTGDDSGTHPLGALSTGKGSSVASPVERIDSSTTQPFSQAAKFGDDIDSSGTHPLEVLPDTEPLSLATSTVPAAHVEKIGGGSIQRSVAPSRVAVTDRTVQPSSTLDDITTPLETLAEKASLSDPSPRSHRSLPKQASTDPTPDALAAEQELLPRTELSLLETQVLSLEPSQKIEPAASPLGRLAKALAAIPPGSAQPATMPHARVNTSKPQSVTAEVKTSKQGATSSMTAALEKWNSSFDLGELSLMATGMWAAAPRSTANSKPADPKGDELSGPEALSLISKPAEELASPTDPTLKLETLPEPATAPKLAANGP